ncbi:hypothetical protein [Mucilaginibacter sp. AK015]|uniref:hypothetical protein n=1 Tax=Mucilaginibacter sp. AK015 TaxID=2723072 RepID=UPI001614919E|nr:hypothetical protein [Mucilaginibacter sp. AK015]MBB5396715.1 hypothetical protein [Mucilaginibacter sp. AK015]
MKKLITTLAAMLFCLTVLAQQSAAQITYNRHALNLREQDELYRGALKNDQVTPGFVSPVSVQLLLGSQGIGADIKYGFLPRLSGRVGFGIIPVNAGRNFHFSSFKVHGQLTSRFSNLHLLADYSPFATQSIRIVGGASYLIKGNANVIISPTRGYDIGNRSVTKDQLGAVYANADWKGLAPYLGVALFRDFPDKIFNVNLDIGSYYLSSPATSFTGTQLLSDNDDNAKQFNKNMSGYRWLPVVQVNFNFRLK